MTDAGSPAFACAGQTEVEGEEAAFQPRLRLSEAAAELLAIVGYITASDGPLQARPELTSRISPLHERLLPKAMERLELIDAFLRGRAAFFVAGKDHRYHSPLGELELAGAALDNCRATTSVVEALLAGRLPTAWEFESMGDTALLMYPALLAA
jgi:hypothetical protein